MKRAAAILAYLALCACSNSDAYLRGLDLEGQLRIEPVQGRPYDYVVRIANAGDVGYDPDDKKERDAVALRYIRHQCPAARILGEDVIEKGAYLTRKAREYLVQIKCNG